MNGQAFDPEALRRLTEDPEMMSRAMSVASALASSGMLGNLAGALGASGINPGPGVSPGGQSANGSGRGERQDGYYEESDPEVSPQGGSGSRYGVPSKAGEREGADRESGGRERQAPGRPGILRGGTHEQRIKLLEAMRPFVPEDKRAKIDFIIRLLGLMQVADQLGLKNILQ